MYTVGMKKIFKSFTFTWWQIELFEVSLVGIGIVIGVQWFDFFRSWIVIILSVSLAIMLYFLFVWLRR